jgi:hypothetical protein
MSWYITIRSDDNYSNSIETTKLITSLSSLPELQQTSPMTFGNSIELPWIQIILAKCNDLGGYNYDGNYIPIVNVVELICSDYEQADWYEYLAIQIAGFLNWEAWEDHEERQIYHLH